MEDQNAKNLVINPSLAKGLRQRERRRLLETLFSDNPISGKGTRAAWLRQMHALLMRKFDGYVVTVLTEGTKPANTIKHYAVIIPAEEDDYIALDVMFIAVNGKNQNFDFYDAPIQITHHAFERVIQSVGTTNIKKAVRILHKPISQMLAAIARGYTHDKEKSHRIYDPFGVFIFSSDNNDRFLLKTVIKADSLEGKKRKEWEKRVGKADETEV